jgi:magnesium transporter
VSNASSLDEAMNTEKLTWIHVQGLRDVKLLSQIAEHFGIHPLALEDIVNVPQRPKQELTETYGLAIARAMNIDTDSDSRTEQVSLVLGRGFVLSFQESYEPRFQPVLDRLKRADARLRKYGPDYLAYVLLDTIVDGYFPMLEQLGERLERLESEILTSPNPDHLQRITRVKRQLIRLRRTTWAQREMVADLLRGDGSLASEQVRAFVRDTLDHCIQIAEVVDMYRESATGLVNTYLSAVGQRTNEIMKTLTIVGSIFIPLTFVAGIYGMNFEHMPELQSRWAYPSVWGVMVVIASGMMVYFYRRGWLTEKSFTSHDQSNAEQADEAPILQTDDWDQHGCTATALKRVA